MQYHANLVFRLNFANLEYASEEGRRKVVYLLEWKCQFSDNGTEARDEHRYFNSAGSRKLRMFPFLGIALADGVVPDLEIPMCFLITNAYPNAYWAEQNAFKEFFLFVGCFKIFLIIRNLCCHVGESLAISYKKVVFYRYDKKLEVKL